jgi:hypothetical protein
MEAAAIGFRVHSGWTAIVALSANARRPSILLRERAHLVQTFTYRYRQPYHTAAKLPGADQLAFVSRIQAEAKRLAVDRIRGLAATLDKQGYELTRSGLLLTSGRPLPALAEILASHSLIHAADGELFRLAIRDASVRLGLECATIKEKDLFDSAARTLALKSGDVPGRLEELGRGLGPPWSQDEKYAALVAWLAAVTPSGVRLSSRVATPGKSRRQLRERLRPRR